MEPKTVEGHFKKVGLHPGGRLANYGPSYRSGNSPMFLWIWLEP